MRALFDDLAVFQHNDEIGVAHSGDAMRDDDAGALAHHPAQPAQDFIFGVRVHRRQRIVENQNAGLADDGARNGNALFLAAGEIDAAFAQQRLEAVGE